jgi:Sel1 repeat
MNQYPEAVQALHDAIDRLPGVTGIDLGIRRLDDVSEQALSLPGEFGDLPHLAIRRTKGGLADEVLVTAEVRLEQSFAGWIALEFLAWWVRDLSRSGHWVQMRPLALPPIAYGTQLGRTLKFAIEFFFINLEASNDPVLVQIAGHATSLNRNIDDYAPAIDRPTRAQHDSIESLETSAANDDALAQLHLAQHYQAGNDVTQDLAAAFHWYERAASHGHPQAVLQLGQCYERGEGVEVNLPEALKWYRQALERGLKDAQSAIDRIEAQAPSGC